MAYREAGFNRTITHVRTSLFLFHQIKLNYVCLQFFQTSERLLRSRTPRTHTSFRRFICII